MPVDAITKVTVNLRQVSGLCPFPSSFYRRQAMAKQTPLSVVTCVPWVVGSLALLQTCFVWVKSGGCHRASSCGTAARDRFPLPEWQVLGTVAEVQRRASPRRAGKRATPRLQGAKVSEVFQVRIRSLRDSVPFGEAELCLQAPTAAVCCLHLSFILSNNNTKFPYFKKKI